LTVDRSPWYSLGPPSGKHGPACDIARLRPHLCGAPENHVVHRTATYAHPLDKLGQHFCRKVDRVPIGERTSSPSVGGADGVNHKRLCPLALGYPGHSVDHADADEAPDDVSHTGCEHAYDHLAEGTADRGAARRLRKQDADHH
jgi:hypothetical protein